MPTKFTRLQGYTFGWCKFLHLNVETHGLVLPFQTLPGTVPFQQNGRGEKERHFQCELGEKKVGKRSVEDDESRKIDIGNVSITNGRQEVN